MEPSVLGLWRVTLSVRWEAGRGYKAGEFAEEMYLDVDGRERFNRTTKDTRFPETQPLKTPAPAKTPIILAPGTLVQVLQPGAFVYVSRDLKDNFNERPPGDRLLILDGPINAGGTSWYRVEWRGNSTYDGIPGWLPSTFQGHPAVAPVAPRCPSEVTDVVDLTALHPAERLSCFGAQSITLGPVMLTDLPGRTAGAAGFPAWLADEATVGMYGRDGLDGVDPPMLVRADPSAVETLPLGQWVAVTGHLDDPAASTCQRHWIEDNGSGPWSVEQTPQEQIATCQEQFVISSVQSVPPP
jgi:hypothetical protein